uniref:Diamine acetyltransferase 1 n=1 Tax=Latimeria chalumnae TaxID=7897 RepID=H3AFC7_LATCH
PRQGKEKSQPSPIMGKYQIRRAKPEDCKEILRLIKVICKVFYKEDYVLKHTKDLLEGGFGDDAVYHCLIMEIPKEEGTTSHSHTVIGFAMYYFTFDSWMGKILYLEDFYVMETYRGMGIGSETLKMLSKIGIEAHCKGMHFLVVKWNKPAIKYYERRGASNLSKEEGWFLFEFSKENLLKIEAEG